MSHFPTAEQVREFEEYVARVQPDYPDIRFFLDPCDWSDIDLTEPDGSAARPYPVAK